MKGFIHYIFAIIGSFTFLAIAYIIALIIYSWGWSPWPLRIMMPITLFLVLAGSFRNEDDKDQVRQGYNYIQAIAAASLVFIFYNCLR